MPRRSRPPFTPSAVLVSAVAIAACSRQAPTPPPIAAAPATLGFAPISFFQDRCARCHGPYGSLYADGMDQRLPETAALTAKIREMVVGPSAAVLGDRELAALVAYHRSLIDGRPLLAVVSADAGNLTGETTPGAAVSVQTTAGSWSVVVEGHTWRATAPAAPLPIPAGQQPPGSMMEATIDGRATRLDMTRDACSHTNGAGSR